MTAPLHRLISKSSSVREGAPAPDLELTGSDGSIYRLSELWAKQTLVVVFLRQLGCTFCRHHVLQLRKEYAGFKQLGAEVVCITQGDPKLGKAFKLMFDLPYPLLMTGGDPAPFQKYGLGRGTISELLGLNMWIKGFFALFSLGPKVIAPPQGDGLQMPGTFIIDRSGTIRLAYRNKDAADNPPNRLLLDKLQQLQGGQQIDASFKSQPPATASAI